MSVLTDRLPTASRSIHTEQPGPLATRPFGLDALTNAQPVDVSALPTHTIDRDSQLSVLGGGLALDDVATMQNTICNTESDGKDAIAVDEDQNDD